MNGNRDQALATNAFGDHFLTDAFAAGHLFNKRDLMDTFAAKLSGNEGTFLSAVAQRAWQDPGLAAIVSGYELTVGGRNIDSAWMLTQMLRTGNAVQPDLVRNAVVNVVHNQLNTDGVEVSNAAGRTWTLGGDKHIDDTSLEEGTRAVAQSQQNVLNILTAPKKQAPDYGALVSAVWDHVPRPTKAGATSIKAAVLS